MRSSCSIILERKPSAILAQPGNFREANGRLKTAPWITRDAAEAHLEVAIAAKRYPLRIDRLMLLGMEPDCQQAVPFGIPIGPYSPEPPVKGPVPGSGYWPVSTPSGLV